MVWDKLAYYLLIFFYKKLLLKWQFCDQICLDSDLLPVGSVTVRCQVLLAVSAAVFLCDSILIVPPDVHRGEDQHQQHAEAAEECKDGNALLLRLQDKGRRQKSKRFWGWSANENERCFKCFCSQSMTLIGGKDSWSIQMLSHRRTFWVEDWP